MSLLCVCAASEHVICAPDMLRARVFPENGGTWQQEYKQNHGVSRRMTGSAEDDEWWAEQASEYLLVELKAELINCMEDFAKASGFCAPGSQMRKKRRRKSSTLDDPANLSSGDEGDDGGTDFMEVDAAEVDEDGMPVLGGESAVFTHISSSGFPYG